MRLKNDDMDWLRAEKSGDEELAEAIFSGLIADLPGIEPRATFVERTVQNVWRARTRHRVASTLAWIVAVAMTGIVLAFWLYELADLTAGLLVPVIVAISHGIVWILTEAAGSAHWWWLPERIGDAIEITLASRLLSTILVVVEFTVLLAIYAFRRVSQRGPVVQEGKSET